MRQEDLLSTRVPRHWGWCFKIENIEMRARFRKPWTREMKRLILICKFILWRCSMCGWTVRRIQMCWRKMLLWILIRFHFIGERRCGRIPRVSSGILASRLGWSVRARISTVTRIWDLCRIQRSSPSGMMRSSLDKVVEVFWALCLLSIRSVIMSFSIRASATRACRRELYRFHKYQRTSYSKTEKSLKWKWIKTPMEKKRAESKVVAWSKTWVQQI